MSRHLELLVLTLLVTVGAKSPMKANAQELPDGYEAGTKQLATFRVPAGMTVGLFAAEPRLASPVAIGLDERNRIFVAEEYRFNLGTEENRTRPFLLEDDLQLQTTADRLRMYEKWAANFDGGMEWFRRVGDQVRMVEDTNGDGRADRSTVFAPDFNETLDGLAAGVMAMDGDVYFTCIPNLWRLRDTDGDGIADERKIIQSGFGVNAGFLGHDLHGLCWGPDGKLYFSVGDRGFHLRTQEGVTLHGPRNGAVFRCLPDGSEMEVVMRGLRNPQEIAFDQFGNLFAADNNCDKGDHSRLVFVIEGASSGWNMAFQSLGEPYLTGPWHAERMWHLADRQLTASSATNTANAANEPVAESPAARTDLGDRPAWLLPPVGKLGAGPSGFTYYPGTGLPSRYDQHFFLCNYTGNGGIETFSVAADGAGFTIIDEHDFLKPISATDCEFGYDGRLYVSDFVNLIWNGGTSGGRIFYVSDPESQKDPVVTETAELVRNGIRNLSPERLAELLGHRDLRVRQRAQFALAAAGADSGALHIFSDATDAKNSLLMRLHGVWGLGQLAAAERRLIRSSETDQTEAAHESFFSPLKLPIAAAQKIVPLLNDGDPEVRAQAVRTLGDIRYQPAAEAMAQRLTDESPRVQMFAALAVGRIGSADASKAVIEMLRTNADADPWLRHAGVMGLAGIGDRAAIKTYAQDPHTSVRLAALLTVRMWLLESQQQWATNDSDEIPVYTPSQDDVQLMRQFLNDDSLVIATEAARAINDLPLETETNELAMLADRLINPEMSSANPITLASDALLRRILNANFRLGGPENLKRVLAFATNSSLPMTIRRDAFEAIGDWTQPSARDRVTGFWRPVTARSVETLAACQQLLAEQLPALIAATPDELQNQLVQLISRHQLPTDDNVFLAWIPDSDRSVLARTAALRLLASRESSQTDEAIQVALQSDVPALRAEARDVLARRNPEAAFSLLADVAIAKDASILERQRAILTLAAVQSSDADRILLDLSASLTTPEMNAALKLDVMEAATLRGLPELKTNVDRFKAEQAKAGLLAQHLVSVEGGDAERGRSLFVGHRVAQCVRCHKIGTLISGGNAGPDLAQVARRHDRVSLLQSLVEPSAKIARGFEAVTLILDSGRIMAGTVKSEDNGTIVLEQTDGKLVTVDQKEIEERTVPRSAMPEMHRALTSRELRDLVEFLSTIQ